MKRKILPIVLGIIVLGIAAYFVYDYVMAKYNTNENIIEASGIIEINTVILSAGSSGKLLEAKFSEGDKVKTSDTVAKQDASVLESQIQVTQANIDLVQAQIDSAEIQYSQAIESALLNSDQAYEMEKLMATYNHFIYYDEPLSITKSDSDNYSSSNSVSESQSSQESKGAQPLPGNSTISGETNTNMVTDSSGYSTSNSITYAGSAQKKSVQMQLADAENKYDLAKLKLEQVKANDSSIRLAEKNLGVIKAQIDLYRQQLKQYEVTSPIDGIVLAKLSEPGEFLLPGTQIYEIGDMTGAKCNIYIPESRYGKIFLGQDAKITVDSYPGEQFTGKVTKISDKAEFTPKNIQTKEDRVTTVFKITISIDNKDMKLKPGMPADIEIEIAN
jgi:HlyD family secretion protein